MAGSILSSQLEDPPLPGAVPSIEHLRASFTLSGSVASVAHSFTASYSKQPNVEGGVPNQYAEVWVDSRSASGATFNVRTNDNSVTASNAGSIIADFRVEPDLS